jgi:hypothetical protein
MLQFETRPAGLGARSLLPNVVHYVHPSGDRQALTDFKQLRDGRSVESEKKQSFEILTSQSEKNT